MDKRLITLSTETLRALSKSGEGEGGAAAPEGAAATPPAGEGGQPGNQPPASGLPSDVAAAANTPNPFAIPEDRIKDGKIDGKWNSIDDVFKSYDEITKAYQREKSAQANDQQNQQQLEQQKELVMELTNEFRDAGMQLTPEIEQKAVDAGIDIRDVKLTAMEVTQKLDAAHSIVGGREIYEQMIADMGAVMTDAQKAAFDKDVTGGMSEFAIRGLHAQWMEKNGGQAPTEQDRLRGQQPRTPGGVQGYTSQQEMMADLSYLNTPRGRNDSAARAKYEARKAKTADSVIYGR